MKFPLYIFQRQGGRGFRVRTILLLAEESKAFEDQKEMDLPFFFFLFFFL
jgi:hypothetical protein